MKEAALAAHWQEFRLGNANPTAAVEAALQPFIAGQPLAAEQLAKDAAKYALRKAAQKQCVTHTQDGEFVGGKFYKNRTTLTEDIHRSREGTLFRLPAAIDDINRQAILDQTGVPYQGGVVLGEGANGRVQIAETLTAEGRRDRVLAGKTAFGGAEERKGLGTEISVLTQAPDADVYSRVRESYVGRTNLILLQEFAAGGTCQALHNRLAASDRIDPVEKQDVLRTLARIYINAIALLHEREPPIHHGDIKDENFLVAQQADAATRIILADFGLALIPGPGTQLARQTEQGDRVALVRMLRGMNVQHPEWNAALQVVGDQRVTLRSALDNRCFESTLSADQLTQTLARL